MLSKNKISTINALQQKKQRQSTGLFVVEGEKIVDELLATSWDIADVFATSELFEKYVAVWPSTVLAETHLFAKISSLKTPAGVLAVVKQKQHTIDAQGLKNKFTLCLDGVRDPGNLGTIIRIADWFGIENIVCSEDTVDVYNSKTIQATMGSFLRVHAIYKPLPAFLKLAKENQIPIFGAVLNGQNVYQKTAVKAGIIVMGSESHGISDEVLTYVDEPISIPSKLLSTQNVDSSTSIDSLNVAIATAIICGVFSSHHSK
jgi:TrmH family RNA methyltransferase